ncbi:hypothetical protein DFH08DRAFT_813807 [Mycena albidolilacea]|uniref:Uncharacterized protein n=1 Tax=Mycena albidolilacea TaxID=1033008 RepID=A0AAD7EL91_9AGAR|nr:hypothetical protein DFH08DRAFT_813807 [Mycena albidolilacea]
MSKQTRFIFLFCRLLASHLNFSFFTGIYMIYTLFKRIPDTALVNCSNRSSNQTFIDRCHERLKILKILVVVTYSVTWLMELWGIFIITSYVQQLKEEVATEMMPPIVAIPNTPMHF